MQEIKLDKSASQGILSYKSRLQESPEERFLKRYKENQSLTSRWDNFSTKHQTNENHFKRDQGKPENDSTLNIDRYCRYQQKTNNAKKYDEEILASSYRLRSSKSYSQLATDNAHIPNTTYLPRASVIPSSDLHCNQVNDGHVFSLNLFNEKKLDVKEVLDPKTPSPPQRKAQKDFDAYHEQYMKYLNPKSATTTPQSSAYRLISTEKAPLKEQSQYSNTTKDTLDLNSARKTYSYRSEYSAPHTQLFTQTTPIPQNKPSIVEYSKARRSRLERTEPSNSAMLSARREYEKSIEQLKEYESPQKKERSPIKGIAYCPVNTQYPDENIPVEFLPTKAKYDSVPIQENEFMNREQRSPEKRKSLGEIYPSPTKQVEEEFEMRTNQILKSASAVRTHSPDKLSQCSLRTPQGLEKLKSIYSSGIISEIRGQESAFIDEKDSFKFDFSEPKRPHLHQSYTASFKLESDKNKPDYSKGKISIKTDTPSNFQEKKIVGTPSSKTSEKAPRKNSDPANSSYRTSTQESEKRRRATEGTKPKRISTPLSQKKAVKAEVHPKSETRFESTLRRPDPPKTSLSDTKAAAKQKNELKDSIHRRTETFGNASERGHEPVVNRFTTDVPLNVIMDESVEEASRKVLDKIKKNLEAEPPKQEQLSARFPKLEEIKKSARETSPCFGAFNSTYDCPRTQHKDLLKKYEDLLKIAEKNNSTPERVKINNRYSEEKLAKTDNYSGSVVENILNRSGYTAEKAKAYGNEYQRTVAKSERLSQMRSLKAKFNTEEIKRFRQYEKECAVKIQRAWRKSLRDKRTKRMFSSTQKICLRSLSPKPIESHNENQLGGRRQSTKELLEEMKKFYK